MVAPITARRRRPRPPSTPPSPRPTRGCCSSRGSTAPTARTALLAVIEQVGRLPSGEPAVVVRGMQRARIGAGVSGAGAALWVQATPVEDSRGHRPRPASLPPTYKALVDLDPAAARRLAGHRHRAADERPRPLLSDTRRLRAVPRRRSRSCGCSRPPTSTSGWRSSTEWGARRTWPSSRSPSRIRDDVREGMEKTPARVPAAPAARRHPQGARRGRAGRRRGLPRPGRAGRPARQGPRGRAARGRQARARQRPEPRGGLDPHLARHRARAAVERRARRTAPTSRRPARCSTPTTTAWTT